MILTGKAEELGEKPVPVPTLPTTNPTQTALGAIPGLCGENPATNLCGTEQSTVIIPRFMHSHAYRNVKRYYTL